MPYFNPIAGFEPGQTTKNFLLYVKKQGKVIGHAKFSGFIQDKYFDVIMALFVFAMTLETVGVMYIIGEMDMSILAGVGAVSFLILLDVAFAFVFHLKTKVICLCENEMLMALVNGGGDAIVDPKTMDLKSRMRKAKISGFFVGMLICLMAAIKMFFFITLQFMDLDVITGETLFVCVSYIIVAAIHLYATGYAIFGLLARYLWTRDEKEFIRDRNSHPIQKRYENIITQNPIADATVAGHKIERLLKVDLVRRRIELGTTLEEKIRQDLREKYQQEYTRRKGVTLVDMPKYEDEIEMHVNQELEEMCQIEIDPKTAYGNLHLGIKTYLADTLVQENISDLQKGQTLYQLQANGLLTDDQLLALAIASPESTARTTVALHGLRLQFSIIGVS
jgi:hypothetical protein